MNWRKVFIGAVLLIAFASGRAVLYSRSERFVLDNSDQFILYSLLPHPPEGDARIKGKFHRNGILGEAQITDPEQKARLVNALYGGFPSIVSSSVDESACFNPRHGIRATHGGRTVEAEICFECAAVYLHENGKSIKQTVSQEPQKVFDQALIGAKLPLGERPH